MKKIGKISIYVLTLIMMVYGAFLSQPDLPKAEAHDPNNLISNDEFINWRALDADGIQAFLNTKAGSLKSYREGGLSAAQIIYNASRSSGLNPVVILATLQKEESLIESSTNFAYRVGWAMGYGICDGCDSNDPALQKYRGFTYQVMNGAWQLMYNYRVYATNGSCWNVGRTMSIDGTNVVFSNHATSSLYRYTPHLSGNESFNRIYNIYRTYRPPATYAAKLIAKVGLPVQRPGQKSSFFLYYQNLGTATWFKTGANPMHVGNSSPRDHYSKLFGGNNRWEMLNTTPVYRYQVAVFKMDVTAPNETGTYTEKLQPVMEGVQWFGDEASYVINVGGAPAVNKLALIKGAKGATSGPETYGAQLIAKAPTTTTLVAGQKLTVYLYYKNTGNTIWTKTGANPARVGNSSPNDRSSRFTGGNIRWNMLQPSIYPGQVGIFSINITAPSQKGTYTEKFRPVIEGKTWTGDEATFTWTVR